MTSINSGWTRRGGRRRGSFLGVLVVVVFLAVLVTDHAVAAPRVLRVGAYANPPKIDRLDDGTMTGFWPGLVAEIAAREGWQVTWVWGSWSEGLDRLRTGEIDMMPDVAYSPERARSFAFAEESVILSWTRLYVEADNRTVRAIPDLVGLTIAALAGSVNLEGPGGLRELDSSFGLGCTFLELPDYEAVFRAVEEGRADGGITNRNYGNLRAPDYRVRRTAIIFQPSSLRFAFPMGAAATPELIAATDHWLDVARQDDASVYYALLVQHFEAGVSERRIEVVPGWLRRTLRLAIPVVVIGLFALVWSRWQVRRRKAELAVAHRALLVSERRYGEIFDSTSDAIVIHDADTGRLLEVNRAMLEMYGCTRDEALSLLLTELSADVPPYTSKEAGERLEAAARGDVQIFEWHARRLDGETFWVEVALKLAQFGGDRCVIAVVRDIGDRLRMEREVLKNAKLQSLGVLAGGIAHDFNNLLTAVLGNVSLAMSRLPGDNTAVPLLEETEAAALRAQGLAQQLLTFARGGEPVRSITDITEVVRDAAEFVMRGSGTSCTFHLPTDLRPADVDAGQIGQVVQNLVINARQAMTEGGHIVVTCADIEGSAGGDPAGPLVRITIVDDGPGIAPADLEKIFDPYFSTKAGGSGLGLSICHSIVARHGGDIRIDSRVGAGTTVVVDLPAAERVVAVADEGPRPSRKFDKRILIMDDDEMVRTLLARMLKHFGCRVDEAGEGAEAVAIFERLAGTDDPVDLVILDLTIPGGMGGLETLERIHDIDPGARAVVSSGYSNDPVVAHHRQYGFQGVIVKPYRLEDLNDVVAAALA